MQRYINASSDLEMNRYLFNVTASVLTFMSDIIQVTINTQTFVDQIAKFGNFSTINYSHILSLLPCNFLCVMSKQSVKEYMLSQAFSTRPFCHKGAQKKVPLSQNNDREYLAWLDTTAHFKYDYYLNVQDIIIPDSVL